MKLRKVLFALIVAILVFDIVLIVRHKRLPEKPSPSSDVEASTKRGTKQLHEKAFHDEQEKIIKAHARQLIEMGRIDTEDGRFDATSLIGTYGWYSGICDENVEPDGTGGGPCYFGAYTFSPEAFEQAKKVFIFHGQMGAGSDLLIDVGKGVFDQSAIGGTVPFLTYCALTGGKLRHCDGKDDGIRDAKVVAFVDQHTLRLNKKAKWDADYSQIVLQPPDWVDYCNCTNNFFQGPTNTPIENERLPPEPPAPKPAGERKL